MSAKVRKYLETQKAKGKKIATLLDFRQKMSNFARKKSQNVLCNRYFLPKKQLTLSKNHIVARP